MEYSESETKELGELRHYTTVPPCSKWAWVGWDMYDKTKLPHKRSLRKKEEFILK